MPIMVLRLPRLLIILTYGMLSSRLKLCANLRGHSIVVVAYIEFSLAKHSMKDIHTYTK